MPGMEPTRALIIKLALEHIDHHRGDYATLKEQKQMLQMLIDRYGLRIRKWENGRSTREDVKLTTAKYRGELRTVAKKHGTDVQGVFASGSSAIHGDFLRQIGHLPYGSAADRNNEKDEVAVADAPVDTERPSSSPETVQETIADMPGDRLKTESEDDPNAERNAATDHPAPAPSTLSTRAPNMIKIRKRKRSPDDESGPHSAPLYNEVQRAAENDTSPVNGTESTATMPVPGKETQKSTGQPDLLGTKDTAAHSSTSSFNPTLGLLKLSDHTIVKGMDEVWANIRTYTQNLLPEIQDENRPGEMNWHPNSDLKPIYQRIFNADWPERAAQLALGAKINCRTIVEAFVAAALFNSVWTRPVPWRGPKEILSSLSESLEYIEGVMRAFNQEERVSTVMWQAGFNMVHDKKFQEGTVRAEAKKLANEFMFTFSKFVKALSSREPDPAFWLRRTTDIANIFSKTLILKGQMEAAPEYYQCSWIESGARVDPARMEELHESEGEQEVVWSVTPLVEKKSKQDAAWQVACPAKVLSRPRVQ